MNPLARIGFLTAFFGAGIFVQWIRWTGKQDGEEGRYYRGRNILDRMVDPYLDLTSERTLGRILAVSVWTMVTGLMLGIVGLWSH